MTREEYNAQFQDGTANNEALKEHIKELEHAMSGMRKASEGDGSDKTGSEPESAKLSQELGEPELADFAHLEGLASDGGQR